ncbi:hypothetical protein BpHYR1_046611 [Brachionus plicatilis]|uniref:Uncharacterized protein n=1 Tax=Brachionus plicatilis TaxID=10195 RepID=A0A3M7P111_BRAPC|nr:hypothetical protein BpHYR1_046611 [Brachionus plicatilis]
MSEPTDLLGILSSLSPSLNVTLFDESSNEVFLDWLAVGIFSKNVNSVLVAGSLHSKERL